MTLLRLLCVLWSIPWCAACGSTPPLGRSDSPAPEADSTADEPDTSAPTSAPVAAPATPTEPDAAPAPPAGAPPPTPAAPDATPGPSAAAPASLSARYPASLTLEQARLIRQALLGYLRRSERQTRASLPSDLADRIYPPLALEPAVDEHGTLRLAPWLVQEAGEDYVVLTTTPILTSSIRVWVQVRLERSAGQWRVVDLGHGQAHARR